MEDKSATWLPLYVHSDLKPRKFYDVWPCFFWSERSFPWQPLHNGSSGWSFFVSHQLRCLFKIAATANEVCPFNKSMQAQRVTWRKHLLHLAQRGRWFLSILIDKQEFVNCFSWMKIQRQMRCYWSCCPFTLRRKVFKKMLFDSSRRSIDAMVSTESKS